MSRAVILCVLLGACSTPDLKIVYHVADGITGPTCGSTSCGDVPMTCRSVLHLRVLRPSDPNAPFISICEEVPPNSAHDLCAIGQINLPVEQLPREVLEVQVTVWPRDSVLNDETGELDCSKVPVEFDATMGFPVSGGPTHPAFGGRTFYHPGDAETVVTLGCTDLPSINNGSCSGANAIDVTATVGDFENLPFSVNSSLGDRLGVAIGEPKPYDDGVNAGHRLLSSTKPPDIAKLDRTVVGPTPAWGAGVDLAFQSSACLQVTENIGQTTLTLRCRPVKPDDKTIDAPGVRLPKATLDQVLSSLSLSSFPEHGLTVGIVLDHLGNPAAGFEVSTTAGTVEYLNATRTGTGGTQTSVNGMFVSQDAPYGTIFSTFQIGQTITAVGGLVDFNVTVVVLLFDQPPIGG